LTENHDFSMPHLYLTPPIGVTSVGPLFRNGVAVFYSENTILMGLPRSEIILTIS